jgi:hypothetical protein
MSRFRKQFLGLSSKSFQILKKAFRLHLEGLSVDEDQIRSFMNLLDRIGKDDMNLFLQTIAKFYGDTEISDSTWKDATEEWEEDQKEKEKNRRR